MKTIITLTFFALSIFGADAPASEADIRVAYWQAAAKATAAQAALRDSMTDQQKAIEKQRDAFGAQADAARKQMEALCASKGQALDPAAFECVKTAPAPAKEAK